MTATWTNCRAWVVNSGFMAKNSRSKNYYSMVIILFSFGLFLSLSNEFSFLPLFVNRNSKFDLMHKQQSSLHHVNVIKNYMIAMCHIWFSFVYINSWEQEEAKSKSSVEQLRFTAMQLKSHTGCDLCALYSVQTVYRYTLRIKITSSQQ